jgi:hypothetical protein
VYEAENYGIVFIDEFDKIAKPSTWQNSLVSSEGVQRDLLPIIEGTKVWDSFSLSLFFISNSLPCDPISWLGGGAQVWRSRHVQDALHRLRRLPHFQAVEFAGRIAGRLINFSYYLLFT